MEEETVHKCCLLKRKLHIWNNVCRDGVCIWWNIHPKTGDKKHNLFKQITVKHRNTPLTACSILLAKKKKKSSQDDKLKSYWWRPHQVYKVLHHVHSFSIRKWANINFKTHRQKREKEISQDTERPDLVFSFANDDYQFIWRILKPITSK